MNKEESLIKLIKTIYKIDNVTEIAKKSFLEILQELTQKEEEVVKARFGLDDGEPKIYKEIGEKLGLSAQRIYQINKKVLIKLRHPVRRKKVLGIK